jgi:hypothetical protein
MKREKNDGFQAVKNIFLRKGYEKYNLLLTLTQN